MKQIRIMSLALSALLLSACASDEFSSNVNPNGGFKDSVRVDTFPFKGEIVVRQARTRALAEMSTDNALGRRLRVTPSRDDGWELPTRHTIQDMSDWVGMYNRNLSIKIYDGPNIASDPYNIYNSYFVDKTGNITAQMGPFFWKSAAITASSYPIHAWYPATGDDVDLTTFSVKKNQGSFARCEGSDLLFGTTKTSNTTTPIKMYHKTSKITVIVGIKRKYTTGFHDYYIQTKLNELRLSGAILGGTFTQFPGVVDGGSAPYPGLLSVNYSDPRDTITTWISGSSDVNPTTGMSYDTCVALIPPQNDCALTIILNVGNVIYTGAVEEYDYEQGRAYVIQVDLNDLNQVVQYATMDGAAPDSIKPRDFLCKDLSGKVFHVPYFKIGEAVDAGFTPFGIVCDTLPTEAEYARGWTHGHAMALVNASNGCPWYNSVVEIQGQEQQYTYSLGWTGVLGIGNNCNGYQESKYVLNNRSDRDRFSAIVAANNFNEVCKIDTIATSGWYLPSTGQWWNIVKYIGKYSGDNPSGDGTNFYAPNEEYILNQINGVMGTSEQTYSALAKTSNNYFWTSTENSDANGVAVMLNTNNNIYVFYPYDKENSGAVRAVCAF